MKITSAVSSLVIKNVATGQKVVRVLGSVSLVPGRTIDVFKAIPAISEAKVIDSLRAPHGSLYKEIYLNKNLKVISHHLILLDESNVTLGNIRAENAPESGKVLSVSSESKLEWIYGDMAARLQYSPPLKQDGDDISLPKADAFTNGYLSKDDWVLFKGKSKGLRIWQYQDFDGDYSNPLILSKFENGDGLSFNGNLVVDGTAVAVNRKDYNSAPRVHGGLRSMFASKVHVTQHVRDTVFFDNLPVGEQKIRVFFLVILPDGFSVPSDYIPPTDYVRATRIEYFDAIDIDSGGAKSIFGDKIFNDSMGVKGALDIGDGLSVSGGINSDSLQIREGSLNGYSLVSNAIGDASWESSPVVSSSPPPNSYNGRMWIKSPEYVSFIYDGNRSKWVGLDGLQIHGQKNSTSVGNSYMNGPDNIPHNITSMSLPYDAVLVGLIATGEKEQSWIAEVHVGNRLSKDAVLHVVNSDYASTMNLNVDFKQGDKVQLFASGSSIVMPDIVAIFKQKA